MSKKEYDVIMASIKDSLEARRLKHEQDLNQDPEYGAAIERDKRAGLEKNAKLIEARQQKEIEDRLKREQVDLEKMAFEEHGGKEQMLRDILKNDFADAHGVSVGQELSQSPQTPERPETETTYDQDEITLREDLMSNQDMLAEQFKENANDIQKDNGLGR